MAVELELGSSFEHSPRKRIWSIRTCGIGGWLDWGSEGPISRASYIGDAREIWRKTGKKTDIRQGSATIGASKIQEGGTKVLEDVVQEGSRAALILSPYLKRLISLLRRFLRNA